MQASARRSHDMNSPDYESASPPFDAASIERPDPSLLTYYIIASAMTLVAFPIIIIPNLFRYYTLRYKFDDKGVSMSWGIVFHRQTYLTYRRIQDIHVTRNLLHRWLGLAAVAVQTAAGSAAAEMTIEGIRNPEALRDFLYAKMRGARPDHEIDTPANAHSPVPQAIASEAASADEVLLLLREIRDQITQLHSAGEKPG